MAHIWNIYICAHTYCLKRTFLRDFEYDYAIFVHLKCQLGWLDNFLR